MRAFGLAILGAVLFAATAAQAGECPGNPNALGTSRTIVVDPTEHPRLGSMQYRESLPLRDHEVVFTFDDGPLPPRSTKVLDILASECIKATYFLVGKMARSYPEVVRRIRAEGHTLGNHSYSHPLTFQKMPLEKAQVEINDGFASIAWALGDGTQAAPFFRIPGLLRADGVERYLASREVQVWSADFPADDWFRKLGSQQVYQRAMQRIEAHHKGILLLHDIHQRTVDALPMIIRDLKAKGYHIVHVVPASATMPKTVTAANEWTVRGRSLWQQTPIFADIDPELPAPAPESFGYVRPFDINSVVHGPDTTPSQGGSRRRSAATADRLDLATDRRGTAGIACRDADAIAGAESRQLRVSVPGGQRERGKTRDEARRLVQSRPRDDRS